MNLNSLLSRYEEAIKIDYIGFWELILDVTNDIEDSGGNPDPKVVRGVVLDLTRQMLSRGFLAGHFADAGEGIVPWPDQNPNHVIQRIESKWDELGHKPTINDICWFTK